jgi:DNA polymerase III delta prime subunit
MNRNAANAFLKILEEPPQRALLVLVAHSPGLLLPTIRSRSRRFPLAALSPETVRGLLSRYRPDLDESSAAPIVRLAGGSIGRALELAAAGGVDLYRNLLALLSRRSGIDPAAAQALADRLARPEADDAYRMFEELLRQLLARLRSRRRKTRSARRRTSPRRRSSSTWAAGRADGVGRTARGDRPHLRPRRRAQSRPQADGARRRLCD